MTEEEMKARYTQNCYDRDSKLLDESIKVMESIAENEIAYQNITEFYFNKVKKPRMTCSTGSYVLKSFKFFVITFLVCFLLSMTTNVEYRFLLPLIIASALVILVVPFLWLGFINYKKTRSYFYKDFNKYNLAYMKAILNEYPKEEVVEVFPSVANYIKTLDAFDDASILQLQKKILPQLEEKEVLLAKDCDRLKKITRKVKKCNSSLHILVEDVDAKNVFFNLKCLYATKLTFNPTQNLHDCIGNVLNNENLTNSNEVLNCAASSTLKEHLRYW